MRVGGTATGSWALQQQQHSIPSSRPLNKGVRQRQQLQQQQQVQASRSNIVVLAKQRRALPAASSSNSRNSYCV